MPDSKPSTQTVKHFEPNDVIISETALGRGLYVLMRGKLAVERDGVRIATISQKGSFVGEISAILGCPCSATVRAETAADLMHIEKITDYLESNPQASYVLAQTLARRIMDMNEKFLQLEQLVAKLSSGKGENVGSGAAEKIQGALTEMQDLVSVDPKKDKRKAGWGR